MRRVSSNARNATSRLLLASSQHSRDVAPDRLKAAMARPVGEPVPYPSSAAPAVWPSASALGP